MFIDDAVTLLSDANIGVRGVSLFWTAGAVLPSVNSTAALAGFLTLQSTGGPPPILMHNSDQTPGYVQPEVQVCARAKTTAPASALALRAWNIFVQRRSLTVNGVWYISIDVKQSEPFELGPDVSGLYRFVFDIRCRKRPL